jgi:uncharacterized lipoprotein YddW (UPF0748 family)
LRRREFLKKGGAGVAGIVAAEFFPALAEAAFDTPRNAKLAAAGNDGKTRALKNWAWITSDTERSEEDWKRLFSLLHESGVKAVLPEMYNGREAFFASKRLPVKQDVLGKILPLAKATELEVHAWMWSMPCMLEEVLKEHHDWYNVNALGESAADKPAYVKYYKFLDPGRPEVREWVQGTVKELAEISELTGIHLDYIRHPDRILPRGLWKNYGIVQDKVYPQYDYGYTPYEREQFKKKFGADPLKGLTDPKLQKEWFQFRLDMVTGLVNDYLVPAAHAKGKMITAAVFPGPSLARENVLQDWGRWNLDAFLPMLYNVFYEEGPEWVRKKTREAVHAVTKPVYSGLFLPQASPDAFREMIEMALGGGASGVSLFSAADLDPAKAKILKSTASA